MTVAEPDLTVLATQVPSIPNAVLIWTVAIESACFLVVSVLRTVWKIPLRWVLLTMYTGLILLSFLSRRICWRWLSIPAASPQDRSPYRLSWRWALASRRPGAIREGEADSFGVITLASIGPILAVLILGLLYRPDGADYASTAVVHVADSRGVAAAFLESLPHYAKEVLVALAPIAGVFVVFQLLTRAFKPKGLARIGVGLVYTFVGLVLFLTGVNVGFLPAGAAAGPGAGSFGLQLVSHTVGGAAGLVYCGGGTGGSCALRSGGDGDRRSCEQERDEPRPVVWYGHIGGAVYGADSLWDSAVCGHFAGLCAGIGVELCCSAYVYRHRI